MPKNLFQTPTAIALLLGSALCIVVAGLHFMADLLAPILLAYTLAVALLPMVKRLESKGLPRPVALAGVFLAAFLAASLLIGYFLVEVQHFAGRLPRYQAMLEARFAALEAVAGRLGLDLRDFRESSQAVPENLTRMTLALIARLLNATASLALFLFMLLTMSVDFPGVSRAFYGQLKSASALRLPLRNLLAEIQAYYRLQTLSNLLSAVAVLAVYLAFRLDFALLWGLLTFFLSYIPRFGMLLSFVPPVLMAFVQYGIERAAWVFLICFVLNGLMDNLVVPLFTKKGLALRPSTVLLASLGWLWVLGPLGALLAMPMTLFVRKLFESSDATLPLAYALSTDDYHALPPQNAAPEPDDGPP